MHNALKLTNPVIGTETFARFGDSSARSPALKLTNPVIGTETDMESPYPARLDAFFKTYESRYRD